MTYSEKLKDPRWQKKRLEVLQRDEFACVWCGDDKSTLHVHHLAYSEDPWDTPIELLLTLCEDCHESDHVNRAASEKELLSALRQKGFNYGDINSLAAGFSRMKPFHVYDVMSSVIMFALENEELMQYLKYKYFESIKKNNESGDDLGF